jgi:hypothetical protein
MADRYNFQQTKPKVFCLGLSKTGTSSIGDALAMLGMRRLTWSRRFSMGLLESVVRRDLQPVFDVAYRYDAMEDLPWPMIYRELDAHFPNAKFILTTRKDTPTWARSIGSQTLGKPRRRMESYRIVFGHHFFHENPQAFIDYYKTHNDSAVRYFREKHGEGKKLLEMCFEAGDGWQKLCDFLDLDIPAAPFPHSNRRRERWYKDLYIDTFFRRQKEAGMAIPEKGR